MSEEPINLMTLLLRWGNQGVVDQLQTLYDRLEKLEKVAAAAKALYAGDKERDCNCEVCRLADALEELEK